MNNQQALLGRLQKRRVVVKTRKRGIHAGSRQSNKFGSSMEFSDFRAYQPGDDIRQIDWNVFGRTQKHYIKRFLDEQELSIAVYLDATSSMTKIQSKWEHGKGLAAALSFMVLAGEDRLLYAAISSDGIHPVKRKGSVYSRRTFLEIQKYEGVAGSQNFLGCMKDSLSKKQQLAILVTDGFEPIEDWESLFKKLKGMKQEFWFFQVLANEELNPSYTGDMKLIDSETGTAVNISLNPSILFDYEKRLKEHNKQLEALCKRYGGQYIFAPEARDLQTILFRDLPAKGLVR
ncbi:DUF58 domain-containing protein [Bacillus sp. ISL-47]|uniref:DUF58 domain-containing protein n=1 Tax=Bacillus sp. ISL-47 TaxID=2819130 RepID=UPI001BE84A86|nr:DUF58 domain-containing protein [Bacillus sp. ISL-47]MBT2688526.1 DUF58 domain-containing protein [Bacillus sp. ISL-47]MBT2708824.1 DUF58 domain-containing protein [Pseudomonas sp. ISL-84]